MPRYRDSTAQVRSDLLLVQSNLVPVNSCDRNRAEPKQPLRQVMIMVWYRRAPTRTRASPVSYWCRVTTTSTTTFLTDSPPCYDVGETTCILKREEE
eukprot:gene15489-biopygen449